MTQPPPDDLLRKAKQITDMVDRFRLASLLTAGEQSKLTTAIAAALADERERAASECNEEAREYDGDTDYAKGYRVGCLASADRIRALSPSPEEGK